MLNVYIGNVNIHVDTTSQKKLCKDHGYWDDEANVSLYPLNTDGMDLRGRNFLVENCVIDCYDDAVAIKPTNSLGNEQNCTETGVCRKRKAAVSTNIYANCSQDMVIRNLKVRKKLKFGNLVPVRTSKNFFSKFKKIQKKIIFEFFKNFFYGVTTAYIKSKQLKCIAIYRFIL